jgi:Cytochrome oxidase complex assembly protein 1
MKWFLPTLILACLLLIGGFVVGLFAIVHTMFVDSYPYKTALARANASPEVAAKIGTPVHVGWLIMGNINISGPTGNAAFDIPISGPRGKGEIVVVAKERGHRWTFETLEVDIDGEAQPIQLSDDAHKPALETPAAAIR